MAQSVDPVWVPGSSQKVCQLTGELNRETGQLTISQTETNYGLSGADLGYSFEHKGKLWFSSATRIPDATLQAHFELAPPLISLVANAEGEAPAIAPNTWVEIKGAGLARQGSDFVNNKMPAQLDNVAATVNGKAAYVFYISPSQINILTPPDALPAGPCRLRPPSAAFKARHSRRKRRPCRPRFLCSGADHTWRRSCIPG